MALKLLNIWIKIQILEKEFMIQITNKQTFEHGGYILYGGYDLKVMRVYLVFPMYFSCPNFFCYLFGNVQTETRSSSKELSKVIILLLFL